MAAMIRAAAQHRGHDPQLAEAMVRRDTEYKIGDETISKKGRLLTLTNKDAERLVGPQTKTLLSEGTVDDLDALIRKIGKENCDQIELTVTTVETIGRYIEAFSVIILGLGLLGLYIEFKTPGVILPGIMGVTLLAIWFWGSNIAGLSGMEEVALFILGVILLLVEVFFFPGVIVPGIIGLILIVTAILMAMIEHYPGTPWYPTYPQISGSVIQFSIALVISFVGFLLVAGFLPQTPALNRLILNSATGREDGFTASTADTSSRLNPAGAARFDDQRLNVVARGDFINPGEEIRIAETHGNRIIVERVKKA